MFEAIRSTCRWIKKKKIVSSGRHQGRSISVWSGSVYKINRRKHENKTDQEERERGYHS